MMSQRTLRGMLLKLHSHTFDSAELTLRITNVVNLKSRFFNSYSVINRLSAAIPQFTMALNKLSIENLDLAGKRVLMR